MLHSNRNLPQPLRSQNGGAARIEEGLDCCRPMLRDRVLAALLPVCSHSGSSPPACPCRGLCCAVGLPMAVSIHQPARTVLHCTASPPTCTSACECLSARTRCRCRPPPHPPRCQTAERGGRNGRPRWSPPRATADEAAAGSGPPARSAVAGQSGHGIPALLPPRMRTPMPLIYWPLLGAPQPAGTAHADVHSKCGARRVRHMEGGWGALAGGQLT